MAAGRAPRGALARLRRSSLLRWRHRPAAAEELLIAPPDLRTQDASFVDEIEAGTFGLAGCVAHARRPLAVRHRAAQRGLGARAARLRLAAPSRRRRGRSRSRPWRANWCANGSPAAGGATRRPGRSTWSAAASSPGCRMPRCCSTAPTSGPTRPSCAAWTTRCCICRPPGASAPDGYPRLLALIALVQADLCIAGHDRQLDYSVPPLAAELRPPDPRRRRPHQPQPGDAGRAAARPAAAAPMLRGARHHAGPALLAAIARMAPMLRTCGWATACWRASTASAPPSAMRWPPCSPTTTAADCACHRTAVGLRAPGARRHRARRRCRRAARSGAGRQRLRRLPLVRAEHRQRAAARQRRPAAAPDAHARALARATASHNTLCLDDQSSSTLVRNARLEQASAPRRSAIPTSSPASCRGARPASPSRPRTTATSRASAWCTRARCTLDASGTRLDGVDTPRAAKGVVRFAWDVPFAVHFHLHPEAEAAHRPDAGRAELALDNGEQWRLSATGAALSIEESTHFAEAWAAAAQPVVLRALCGGTPRCAGGSSGWARAARWTPGRADASARKSGRPRRRCARDAVIAQRAVMPADPGKCRANAHSTGTRR